MAWSDYVVETNEKEIIMVLSKIHKSPDGRSFCAHFYSKHSSGVDWSTAVVVKVNGKEFFAVYSNYTWGWDVYDLETRKEVASCMDKTLFDATMRPHIVSQVKPLPYGMTCEAYFAQNAERATA